MKNNNNKFFGILLITVSVLTGCSSINRNLSNLLFPPYPSSDQRSREQVTVEVEYKKPDFDPDENTLCQKFQPKKMQPLSIGLPGAALAAELLVKQIESFLEEEAKRYTASYYRAAVGDHFWTCEEAGNIANPVINVKSFLITRYVNDNVASKIKFKVLPAHDHTAIAIFPISVTVHQTKAKVAVFDLTRPLGFDILAPWTIFQIVKNHGLEDFYGLGLRRPAEIDLKVDLSITGAWLESEGKWHYEVGASQSFLIPAQEFTGKAVSKKPESASNPPSSNNKCENSASFEEAKKECGELFTGQAVLLQPVPRSKVPTFKAIMDKDGKVLKDANENTLFEPGSSGLGFGNFVIGIMVTETDSFGERITEIKDKVKSNEKSLTDRLSGFLGNL